MTDSTEAMSTPVAEKIEATKAPVETTAPTEKADDNKVLKEVTAHNGQVKISLLSLEKDSFELKVENNADVEVKLFGLPQIVLADGEAIALPSFAGDNSNARREEVPAGSYKVFKLSFDNAEQKEIKKITGELFSMKPSVKDKNYSIELN